MKRLLISGFAGFILLFAKAQVVSFPDVPGIVLNHVPVSTKQFVGSPSICILPNGYYIASHDFGPGIRKVKTLVFVSKDSGKHWSKIAEIADQRWSSLFVHKGELYIMGTQRPGGDVLIRRSYDGGYTWSFPIDSLHGRILQGMFHTAPTPVIVHNGRVWRAMEDMNGPKGSWGNSFRAFMLSAPVDADLLRSDSWVASNALSYDSTYLNGDFNGWLEGNAVAAPGCQVVNMLRTDFRKGSEKASIITISPDGKNAGFDPQKGFVDFPGGCKKFSIRYDSESKRYWSLSNFVPVPYQTYNPERARNVLALIWSENLVNWHIKAIVLFHPDVERHGFQYADFQFDGGDIVAVSRTAYDDEEGGAENQHNANFFTFHRIKDFRNFSTPKMWQYLLP